MGPPGAFQTRLKEAPSSLMCGVRRDSPLWGQGLGGQVVSRMGRAGARSKPVERKGARRVPGTV